MASQKYIESVQVPFTAGPRVRMLRYPDGSYRVRIDSAGKPDFAITEAFLQGGDHKIIKVSPLPVSKEASGQVPEFPHGGPVRKGHASSELRRLRELNGE